VAGANDRYLVEVYRTQLAEAAKSLLSSNGVTNSEVYKTWAHAGRDPRDVKDLVKKSSAGDGPGGEPITKGHVATPWRKRLKARLKARWNSLTSWRWDAVSVTRLPAVLSLVFILVWVVILVLLAMALRQSTLVPP
jgi:hypothetical protein